MEAQQMCSFCHVKMERAQVEQMGAIEGSIYTYSRGMYSVRTRSTASTRAVGFVVHTLMGPPYGRDENRYL